VTIGWKRLLPKLEEQIAEHRKHSRREEARLVYPEFFRAVRGSEDMAWMPPFDDFWSLGDLTQLLQADRFSTPVTLERLLAARAAFEDLASRCKLQKQRHLVHDILQVPKPADSETLIDYDAVLDSACAFFRCRCQQDLIRPVEYLRDHDQQILHLFMMPGMSRFSSKIVMSIAKTVLTRLGLDENISFSEVLAMGSRFACTCQYDLQATIGTDFASLVRFRSQLVQDLRTSSLIREPS
jgi:hypothetical protein